MCALSDSDFCILKLLLGNDEGIWSGVFTEEAAITSVAMCVPVQCDAEDVKKAVDAIIHSRLDNSHQTGAPIRSEVKCNNFESKPLSPGAIVVILFCCFTVIVVSLATLCDGCFRVYGQEKVTTENKSLNSKQSEKTPLLPCKICSLVKLIL